MTELALRLVVLLGVALAVFALVWLELERRQRRRPRKYHETPRGAERSPLVTEAIRQGLEQPAGAVWWAGMAPLEPRERQAVRNVIARYRAGQVAA